LILGAGGRSTAAASIASEVRRRVTPMPKKPSAKSARKPAKKLAAKKPAAKKAAPKKPTAKKSAAKKPAKKATASAPKKAATPRARAASAAKYGQSGAPWWKQFLPG